MDTGYIHIDRYSAVPLFKQLKDCFMEAIQSGVLSSGQKLPTENEICDRFKISRPVVRQAYGELMKSGMLERKRGIGSFVKPGVDRGIFMMRLVGYNEELALIGMTPSSELKTAELVSYEPDVFGKLQLDTEQRCLHLERMRYADGLPFTYIENYVPLHLFPGIDGHDYSTESLYRIMKEQYGVYPSRALRSIRAEIVAPDVAPLLHVERGSAVHELQSIAYDQYDRPVDYSIETYPGDTNRFDFVVYKN